MDLASSRPAGNNEKKEREQVDTLVTTEWLSQHLGDPDLVVLDCSVHIQADPKHGWVAKSGRGQYHAGHIPTAGFADLVGDLSEINSPNLFAMPTPEQFCTVMGQLGLGDDSRVVLYNRGMYMWAARVWWMLRWVGFDRAALLDGGYEAWTAEGRPVSTEPDVRTAKTLSLSLRPHLIADRDEILAAVTEGSTSNGAVCLIDALVEDSYRAYHIPGASNVSSRALLDDSGFFRPLEELAALFPGGRSARMIAYCGGGVESCSNIFVLDRLGFTNLAVYTASMQEWAADPANPLEGEAV
jgi:thiosulfate/3-mercaptopyruvate sulfurtransferase